jgi:hypothetical protein
MRKLAVLLGFMLLLWGGQALAATDVLKTCGTDTDCVVKDVGGCCGYTPACVNQNAKTDPEKAKAECAEKGISGICGFTPVESCICVGGMCEAGSRSKVNKPDQTVNE